MRLLLPIAVLMLAWSPPAGAIDREGESVAVVGSITGNPAKGAELIEKHGCVDCHHRDGIATDPNLPHLAGQPAPYLLRQLEYFRLAGQRAESASERISLARRRHPTMVDVLDEVPNQDLAHMAAYYARLPCAPPSGPAVGPPPIATRCVSCHGTHGYGTSALTPNLASQNRRYLVRQLMIYKNTPRDPDKGHPEIQRYDAIMSGEARRLSDYQMAAITRYYSGIACR